MSPDISGLREEYQAGSLHERDMHKDPVSQFGTWFADALARKIKMANAMVLATADSNGRPTARYVLLKEYSEEGFVFYTSSLSLKGRQLAENPRGALVFYWRELHRQVRIEGGVEQLSGEKADKYFQTRPRGSQISAWVAVQSNVVAGREYLKNKAKELTQSFVNRPVPRPDPWIGYRVKLELVEFWQGQEDRLHDRIVYQRNDSGEWFLTRLAP